MKLTRPSLLSSFYVGLAGFVLFTLPLAFLLYRFRADAPFYFLAEDAFYYLSIALHSAKLPFFSLDGVHPTNGFHPLWEALEFTLGRVPFFRLDGPSILARLFAVNALIVASATACLSALTYRLTRRPWLSLIAFTPGLLWCIAGVGSPAFLNAWANVNGMETGLELLFLSVALLLFGSDFQLGPRFFMATFSLGCLVLSRLDDIFFVLALAIFALGRAPHQARARTAAGFLLPVLMIAAYLLYNHHTVGVWMPVSGMAKVGKGYRAGIGETLHLLQGSSFWRLPAYAINYAFSTAYTRILQMLAPMAVATGWLLWKHRGGVRSAPVLAACALGVLLKGAYNFLAVPLGFQGAWYYGASIAIANLLTALFLAEALNRWTAADPSPAQLWPAALRHLSGALTLLGLTFLSFNVVVSYASLGAFASARSTYQQRHTLSAALRASTHAPFLEFQDGELSFSTGLPSMSAFGLAADPDAARAQRQGTYFDLLATRGVTVAAASGTYPFMLANARFDKTLFAVWGFNPREIRNYCFEPFWNDSAGSITLYHIRHQPVCAASLP